MSKRLLVPLFLAAWCLIGLTPPAAAGQEARTETGIVDSALHAKDLAAFQALRKLVANRAYKLTEEQLTDLIKRNLDQRSSTPPHKAPTIEDLNGVLDEHFEVIFAAMLRKSVEGLDESRTRELQRRLEDFVEKHGKVRTEARQRYQTYRRGQLPDDLARATRRLVEDQVAQLHKGLVAYVAGGEPSTESIEKAFRSHDKGPIVAAVRDGAIQTCDAQLRRLLLADAFERIQQEAERVVSNGVRQLESQLDVLDDEPKSQTHQGIVKELNARLTAVLHGQSERSKTDSLWGSYGVFPMAKTRLAEQSQRHFDRRIAAATDQVMREFSGGMWTVPDEHQSAIRREIEKDVGSHHRAADSRELLTPPIREMVQEHRRRIAQVMQAKTRQAPSQYDVDRPLELLQRDIDRHVNAAGTEAHESWRRLQDSLTAEYGQKIVPMVRGEIARDQVRRHAPSLARETWRPTEQSILERAGRFTRQHLQDLDVWSGGLPTEKQVLDETWQLWTNSAKALLREGSNALTAQWGLVEDLHARASKSWPGHGRSPSSNSTGWARAAS